MRGIGFECIRVGRGMPYIGVENVRGEGLCVECGAQA